MSVAVHVLDVVVGELAFAVHALGVLDEAFFATSRVAAAELATGTTKVREGFLGDLVAAFAVDQLDASVGVRVDDVGVVELVAAPLLGFGDPGLGRVTRSLGAVRTPFAIENLVDDLLEFPRANRAREIRFLSDVTHSSRDQTHLVCVLRLDASNDLSSGHNTHCNTLRAVVPGLNY